MTIADLRRRRRWPFGRSCRIVDGALIVADQVVVENNLHLIDGLELGAAAFDPKTLVEWRSAQPFDNAVGLRPPHPFSEMVDALEPQEQLVGVMVGWPQNYRPLSDSTVSILASWASMCWQSSSRVVPIDLMDLSMALDLIQNVGLLELGSYQTAWLEARDFELSVAEARSRGFRTLKHERPSKVIDRVYAEFAATNSGRAAKIKNAYGWFGEWLLDLQFQEASARIHETIVVRATKAVATFL